MCSFKIFYPSSQPTTEARTQLFNVNDDRLPEFVQMLCTDQLLPVESAVPIICVDGKPKPMEKKMTTTASAPERRTLHYKALPSSVILKSSDSYFDQDERNEASANPLMVSCFQLVLTAFLYR